MVCLSNGENNEKRVIKKRGGRIRINITGRVSDDKI